MLTVRIQEKNYSESIMVLKLKDGGRIRSNVRRGQPAGNLTGGQGTVTTENGRFLFFS